MDKHLLRFDKTKKLTFLDFETFNLCLNFSHNRPWQAGLIKVNGDTKIDEKDLLIKWETKLKISKEAAFITRYSQNKMDNKGVDPKYAFDIMYDWLNDSDYIIGHNILGFDIYLLKEYCLLYKKDYKQFIPKIIDTYAIAKGIGMDIPYKPEDSFLEYQYKMISEFKKGLKTSLTALGKQNNIEHDYDNLHDAVNDLLLNLKVWNILKYQIEI